MVHELFSSNGVFGVTLACQQPELRRPSMSGQGLVRGKYGLRLGIMVRVRTGSWLVPLFSLEIPRNFSKARVIQKIVCVCCLLHVTMWRTYAHGIGICIIFDNWGFQLCIFRLYYFINSGCITSLTMQVESLLKRQCSHWAISTFTEFIINWVRRICFSLQWVFQHTRFHWCNCELGMVKHLRDSN
jgi:hypothetical protein